MKDQDKTSDLLLKEIELLKLELTNLQKTEQENQEKFIAFYEYSMDAILLTSPDGTIISANPAACKLFDRTEKEICELGRSGLIDVSDPRLPTLLEEREKNGKAIGQLTMFKKDGTAISTEVSSAVFKDKFGNTCTSMIIRDITERKLAEIEIQKKSAEMQSVLKSMLNAFVIFESVFDENGKFISYRFVYINDAYEEITGVKNEKVKGKTVHEVWPGTEASWIEKYGHVAITGETLVFDNYHDPTKKLYHCRVYRPWDSQDRFCVIFEDITEQSRKDKALKENEEKFRSITEQMSDMIFLTNEMGIITFLSPASEALFGYKSEEMVGRSFTDFLEESQIEYAVQKFKSTIQQNEPSKNLELKMKRKNGSIFFGELSGKFYQSEKLTGSIGVIRDITERKLTEEKLRKNQNLLNEVEDMAKVGGWEMDLVARTSNWTRGTYDILEINYEDPIPGPDEHLEYYLPEYREMISNKINNLVENGTDLDFEAEALTAKGKVRWFKAHGRRSIKHGKCVKIYGTLQDITERILAEQELITAKELAERNENELKKAQELAHIGSWYLDIATNQVTWSEELYKMYGFDPALPVPPYTEHMKLFAPESWDLLSSSLENTRKTGIAYELELRTIRKDGSNGWMWVRGETIQNAERKTIALWGAAQDITEKKLAEEAIKASEEKFRSLFDNINVGVALHEMIFDKKGNPVDFIWLDANQNYEKITSLKKKDIVGKRGKEIIPNIEQKWIEIYGKVASSGEPVSIIDHSEYLDKYWEIKAYSPGKNLFAVAMNDITDIRKGQLEILHAKETAERYLDMAGSMFISLNKQAEIVLVNQKALEILEYDNIDELIGKNWFDTCIPKQINAEVKKVFDQIMSGVMEAVEHFDNDIITKSGTLKTISWYNTFVNNEEGELVGLLSSGADVTERKRVEKELARHRDHLEELVNERTAELEEKNKRLEDFNKLFVGREFRIKELRTKVKDLEEKLGI